jgi:DNA-binding NarL/FixJ family response regulator
MITVALAEDHNIVREGLRLLLESDPEFVVVGETNEGVGAIALVKRLLPQILIADLRMPQLDGFEMTRKLTRLKLRTRVIILTMYGDAAYLLDALGSGAAGFVAKDSCGTELFQAIRDVAAGGRYLSPVLSEDSTRSYLTKHRTSLSKISSTLTARERKVLRLVLQGASNSEISVRLKMSVPSVEADLINFIVKLGVNPDPEPIRNMSNRGERMQSTRKH